MIAGTLARRVDLAPDALIALHAANPQRYPALLESTAAGPRGRFDILFAFPLEKLTSNPDGSLAASPGVATLGSFLNSLDCWWSSEKKGTVPLFANPLNGLDGSKKGTVPDLPFTGGWLVYLGYELAGEIEPRLRLPRVPHGPVATAVRVPAAVVCERASGAGWIVAESGRDSLLESIAQDVRTCTKLPELPASLLENAIEEEPAERYLQAVRHTLDYIAAGDTYQANLSRGWHGQLRDGVEAQHLYRRLRETNPGPFCALAVFDGLAVVSSSPERLVEVRDGWVATRPIAGTRPRDARAATDHTVAQELYTHPKERAEHIMLVDLERNDLGRVCEAGSVTVDELMTIETYAHVLHIVSNVRGRLAADVTPGRVLAAVFPGGTITGCPKVRCMEIIAELEGCARGAYTGSLGYLNRDGSMDMNILIRSLDIRGRSVALRAGAGIVADSIPERELEETRAKARGVLRALEPLAGC